MNGKTFSCPNCDHQIACDVATCPNCGHRIGFIESPARIALMQEKERKWAGHNPTIPIGYLVALVILILAVIFFFCSGDVTFAEAARLVKQTLTTIFNE